MKTRNRISAFIGYAAITALIMLCPLSNALAQPKKSGNQEVKKSGSPEVKKSINQEAENETKRAKADSLRALMDEVPFIARLHLLAKSSADSVVLRYAPSKSGPWKAYNAIGYHIERRDITDSIRTEPFVRLTTQPLKPWTLDEWKQRSKPEDQYAAIAVQCLYGRVSPIDPNKPTSALLDAAAEFENKFGFALFAADNHPHAANGLGLRFVDRSAKAGNTYIYRVFAARRDSMFILDTAYIAVTVGKTDPLPPPNALRVDEGEGKVNLYWKNLGVGFYSGFHVWRKGEDGKEVQLTKIPIVAMTNSTAGKTMEPFYDDSSAGYYKKWTYTVRGVDAFGDLSEAATVTAMGRDKTPPPIPYVNKPLVVGNKVTLTWEMKKEVPDLAGFVVERSDSMYSRYHTMTEKQLERSAKAWLDTNATSDEPYYNIMAVDTAGNISEMFPFYVEIADTLPPATPQFISGTIDTNGIVKLMWHLGKEKDLLGYRVLWANDSTHEFTQRTNLVLQDTVFFDSVSVKTLTKNIYYKIVAVDTRYFHSEPTSIVKLRRPDVLPPETPVFTNVFVTDSSVVLNWEYSRSDDVKEQILFKRKQGDKEWKELRRFPPTANAYTDAAVSKRTMFEYQLQAVDSTGLKSPLSSAVQGRPYDSGRRLPIANLQAAYDAKSNSVNLSWSYSGSIAERYWFVVYRGFDDYDMKQYRAVGPKELQFADNDLVGKGRYRYAVRVITVIGESPMSEVKELVVE